MNPTSGAFILSKLANTQYPQVTLEETTRPLKLREAGDCRIVSPLGKRLFTTCLLRHRRLLPRTCLE
jgi:hypothetical protein